jgi:CheY-like chemotaxis protein
MVLDGLLTVVTRMPIMDGRTAAKEIRKLEANLEPRDDVSLRIDGRIPIFAVSASLYESDRQNLARDFDGWLLKPLGEFGRGCGGRLAAEADRPLLQTLLV